MLKLVLGFAVAAIVMALVVPDIAQRFLAQDVKERALQTAQPSIAPAGVTLRADRAGHFLTPVVIDGRSFQSMVDTGASVVALTYEDGRSLGLIRAGDPYDVKVNTANGVTEAKRVMLNAVSLGTITVRNVEAIVAQEGALSVNLLGMSFLKKLRSFEMRDGRLVLEQ